MEILDLMSVWAGERTSESGGRVEGWKVRHTTWQPVSSDISVMHTRGGNMERGVAFLLVSFQNSETMSSIGATS